jgi:hypothetical protein
MVASAVFITDLQGKSIISRNYRGDVPLTRAVERFAKYLLDTPDEQKKPIFQADGHADFHVEEDVGSSGNDGESYVYVNVSFVQHFLSRERDDVACCYCEWKMCFSFLSFAHETLDDFFLRSSPICISVPSRPAIPMSVSF